MKCTKCNNNMQETMLFTSSVFNCTVCEAMKPFANALSEGYSSANRLETVGNMITEGLISPAQARTLLNYPSVEDQYLTKAEAIVALQQGHAVREYFNSGSFTNSYEVTVHEDLNGPFHAEKGEKPKALRYSTCLGFKIINKGETNE